MIKTPYHTGVVRSQLIRNVAALYDEIRDEIICAFDEILDLKDGARYLLDWSWRVLNVPTLSGGVYRH